MVDGRDLWMAEPESFTFDLDPDENYESDEVFVTWLQRGASMPAAWTTLEGCDDCGTHDYAAHRITIVDDDAAQRAGEHPDGVDDGSWAEFDRRPAGAGVASPVPHRHDGGGSPTDLSVTVSGSSQLDLSWT